MRQLKSNDVWVQQARTKHNDRYDYSKTVYTGAWNKIIIICREHGEFQQAPANHTEGRGGKGQGCPQCMAVEKFDNLRLTNEIFDYYLQNKTIKRLGNYINSLTKISFNCLNCNNIWSTVPNSIRQGIGCPECNNTKLTNEKFDQYLIGKEIPIKRIGEYKDAFIKIDWQCLQCDYVWFAAPNEIKREGLRGGSGCPQCARGKNEKLVGKTIESLGIKYDRKMIRLKSGQKLFPDFYIQKYNLFIEYNGVQHYKPTQFGSMTEEEAKLAYIKQVSRDQSLRDYCFQNGINLLEIDGRMYKYNKLKSFVIDYLKGLS